MADDKERNGLPQEAVADSSNDVQSEKPLVLDTYIKIIDEVKSALLSEDKDDTSIEDEVFEKLEQVNLYLKTLKAEKKSIILKSETNEANLTIQGKETDDESERLLDALKNKRKNEERLNMVMSEYEKAISNLVTEKAVLVKERDTAQMHLANAEAAFSDVHQKYERCKTIIEGFKNNELVMKETIRAHEEAIVKQNNKYEALKTHAIAQLDKANNELVEIRKSHEDEVARLEATLKKCELKNSSLTQSIAWKTQECDELTRICDDLIAKVGH